MATDDRCVFAGGEKIRGNLCESVVEKSALDWMIGYRQWRDMQNHGWTQMATDGCCVFAGGGKIRGNRCESVVERVRWTG